MFSVRKTLLVPGRLFPHKSISGYAVENRTTVVTGRGTRVAAFIAVKYKTHMSHHPARVLLRRRRRRRLLLLLLRRYWGFRVLNAAAYTMPPSRGIGCRPKNVLGFTWLGMVYSPWSITSFGGRQSPVSYLPLKIRLCTDRGTIVLSGRSPGGGSFVNGGTSFRLLSDSVRNLRYMSRSSRISSQSFIVSSLNTSVRTPFTR